VVTETTTLPPAERAMSVAPLHRIAPGDTPIEVLRPIVEPAQVTAPPTALIETLRPTAWPVQVS